jgi:hypothetical protein
MERPIDGGGGQGLGDQLVEAGRAEVGVDRHAAPLVGGVDEAEEALGGIPRDRQEPEFTPSQAEDLYELICERYRPGRMVVTSNRRPRDWYALFPNAVLAETALDRLVNSAHHVVFRGRTYRPLRRPDGGATAFADPDLDPEPGPTLPTRQGCAAENPQDARDDDDEAPRTFADASPHPLPGRTPGGRGRHDPDLVGAPKGGFIARRSTLSLQTISGAANRAQRPHTNQGPRH